MAPTLEMALSKFPKKDAIAFMVAHPHEFEAALKVAVSNQPHLNWRAAWLVGSCMQENDPRVRVVLEQILEVLPQKKDGHQRELLKICLHMELNEHHCGQLFDFCTEMWESIRKSPSLRYTAFKMMVKISEIYPELKHEILVLAQPQYLHSLSPGIKHSIQKMVHTLKKTNTN